MNEEDEICDSIDLVQLLENDEDLLQNELNDRTSNDDNQLNFDNIFDDDSIADKESYKAEPDMSLDPFLMTSESSFNDLLPKKTQAEPVNNHVPIPTKVFHAVPPSTHDLSQPMFQAQTQMQVQPQPQPQPHTVSHDQFKNWSSHEHPINRVPQYGRQSPYAPQPPAPVMQQKTFEQHFEDRKQNLWNSMQKSAMSKANINQMRKASRRHSMTSIDNSRGTSNVDNSRQQLQASFVGGTPSVNQHIRAPRRVSMDMYSRPMYQAQMKPEFPNGGFVPQTQPQRTQPYQNPMQHMNSIDHNNPHNMAHQRAFRRSSWHGGQTFSPLQQAQQAHSIHPVSPPMQYTNHP